MVNLRRLRAAEGHRSEWCWSTVFLGIASFPLFSMFIDTGGPIPKLADDSKPPEKKLSHLVDYMVGVPPCSDDAKKAREWHGEDVGGSSQNTTLRWIGAMGSLMLLPLPSQERARWEAWIRGATRPDGLVRFDSFPLDLAGLSWCGFDLVEEVDSDWVAPKGGSQPWLRPMESIERRRRALLSMLNSVVADRKPASEAEPSLRALTVAVATALAEVGAPKKTKSTPWPYRDCPPKRDEGTSPVEDGDASGRAPAASGEAELFRRPDDEDT